jgi:hypothetical protein
MAATNPRRPLLGGRTPSVALAVLSLLFLTSCGGIGARDSSPPVPYEEVKGDLQRAYDQLDRAIESSTFDRVPALCTALGVELDRAEEAAKRWGILEREKMNLALATARHGLQGVARTAPASGDPELLRANLRPVGEAVQQAEELLDQAAEATKPHS